MVRWWAKLSLTMSIAQTGARLWRSRSTIRTCSAKALAPELIRLLLQYAFADLRLHRIGIRVLAYNKRATRAYEKCGFVIEGRERETAFVNGAWHDDLMMGIVEHKFRALTDTIDQGDRQR